MVLAIGIEYALLIPVDGPKRGRAREKHAGIVAALENLRHILLCLWDGFGQIFYGLSQRQKNGGVGQRDRIVKATLPAVRSGQRYRSVRGLLGLVI